MQLKEQLGYRVIQNWLAEKKLTPFEFQEETWQEILLGKSGLVNAPTGCGKTFAVFLGSIIQFINENPTNYKKQKNNGLQLLWISPLRALANDIGRAMQEVLFELEIPWKVGIRNGDTSTAERAKQKKTNPEVLIITPESLHLLLAQKGCSIFFSTLRIVATDEWHDLIGSKRGVQVELALSRLIVINRKFGSSNLCTWGISATIGNLDEACDVLLSPLQSNKHSIIKAKLDKKFEIISIIPDEIETYPWAGHLGIKLAYKLLPIIQQSTTTLLFINTRGMSETWYQTILTLAPELAGQMALHHGSIEKETRDWIEENLHAQKLKLVVCTASLDLGVDFRPVDTVIQVGSPKGVSRFLQRAGRSGHQPGEISKIYFLPTHSLELVEAAALKEAIRINLIESKEPMLLCFDVLMQYLGTLAVGEGFIADEILSEIKTTYCFRDMTEQEWMELLHQLITGGKALQQYDEYKKLELEHGVYKINNRSIAMRHRMHIGTIVSDAMIKVKLQNGKFLGVIEEYFISRLEPSTSFTFAGRNLALKSIKDMTAIVEPSKSNKSIVPSWQGGRMPLSSSLGTMLRKTLNKALKPGKSKEMQALTPLFTLQQKLSKIPEEDELLIELIQSKDGFHLYVYPFEGRLVHEAMAALLACRISRLRPITFSFVMNDYGFELLSDQPIPVNTENIKSFFSTEHLLEDIQQSVNSIEMAKRKFRDIAVIGGLIFQGFPGEQKKARHLQSSASLLFKVFSEYEPNNVLLRQSYNEVMSQQMEEIRLREALQRITAGRITITQPEKLTPFCFPIKVDSKREELSSEKLEDRIRKMQEQLMQ